MFKFTLYLFVLSCLLTGYRLIGQPTLALPSMDWPVHALSDPAEADAMADQQSLTEANTPIPTIAPLFRTQAARPTATPSPAPTRTVATEVTMSAAVTVTTDTFGAPLDLPEVLIYDDELNTNWSVEHSVNTQYNLWDTTHWFQPFHPQLEFNSGATAIAVSPQGDYGTLLFTVRPENTTPYQRSEVLGISFWLNSGSDLLAKDDLAVAVIGSNALPYWTPNDVSVFPDNVGSFSETRLYYLQVNRAIPADTWVNVIVWLDKLAYDPAYEYVTGFYLKNDMGFRNSYYVDRVTLIMVP
ncbi:MAG: hypothetical protein R3E79_11745 [Caldilineaceae bacterium]